MIVKIFKRKPFLPNEFLSPYNDSSFIVHAECSDIFGTEDFKDFVSISIYYDYFYELMDSFEVRKKYDIISTTKKFMETKHPELMI